MNKLKLPEFWQRHIINIIVISLSLFVFSLSFWFRSQAQDELDSASSLHLQQSQLNLQAEQAAQLLMQYMPRYQALKTQGIIGNPQRLQWLETLQDDIDQQLIPQLGFILSPTEAASEQNNNYYDASVQTKTTRLQLDAALLHEDDFYHLLTALTANAKGLFSAEECTILFDSNNTAASLVNFTSKCELLWYSIMDITQQWEPSVP